MRDRGSDTRLKHLPARPETSLASLVIPTRLGEANAID